MNTPSTLCRIDVWLWRARFFKTRALAQRYCESGFIRLERFGKVTRIEKSSQSVGIGDRLIFAIGARLLDLTIEGTGERRGPAEEARGLYRLGATGEDGSPLGS